MDELEKTRKLARKYEDELAKLNIRDFELRVLIVFLSVKEDEIIEKKNERRT